MPAGQTPHTTIVYAHNDLVDKVQPGDRVNITGEGPAPKAAPILFEMWDENTACFPKLPAGIYRAVPMRVNPFQSNVKSVYKTHIDAIHFRKTDEKRLHGLDEEAEQKLFTEDRVQVLKELAAKPDVYERLSSALAPSIYEHEDIKKVRGARADSGRSLGVTARFR